MNTLIAFLNVGAFCILIGMTIMYYRLKYLVKNTSWYFGCGYKHTLVRLDDWTQQCVKCDKTVEYDTYLGGE